MAYATAEELDALVRGSIPSETATLLLDLASSLVDQEIGRPLAISERTDTFDGPGSGIVWLLWPVVSIVSVHDGDDALDAANYTWSRSGWLTRSGAVWSSDEGAIEVTYTVGFPADDPAFTIAKRITLEVAARVAANPQSLSSLTAEGVTATFGTGAAFHGRELAAFVLDDQQRRDLHPLRARRRRP